MTTALLRQAAWMLALACSVGASLAHDWASPSAPAPERRVENQQQPTRPPGAPWSGRLWAGPAAGMPAAPAATDCRRPPQTIELAGPEHPQRAWHRPRAGALAAVPAPAAAALADHAKASERAEASTATALPAPALQPSLPLPPRRPEAEPVTAGVIDDNADFGAYLAYRQRSQARGVQVRDRDISERYRLEVHDATGRAVPDALVTLHAGGRALPLWARTDAGGLAWLHPRAAGIDDPTLEVRVSRRSGDGLAQGSALLRRGQRDALQVRLDAAVAPEAARLDLVFLVDATGSTADEIDKLRRSLRTIADQIARLPSRPDICWSLVAYRDRGDEFFVRAHDFTDELGAFQQVLSGLRAAGGGDYPEAMNQALHTAVHRLAWRGEGATRLVVLVADAPPHLDEGSPWYDDDMQGALARGIKFFGVAASGLDASGEHIQRQIAQYTGGRFVFLTYDKANDPASGPGRETVHDVGNYSVETLDKLVVRLVREELARRPG